MACDDSAMYMPSGTDVLYFIIEIVLIFARNAQNSLTFFTSRLLFSRNGKNVSYDFLQFSFNLSSISSLHLML